MYSCKYLLKVSPDLLAEISSQLVASHADPGFPHEAKPATHHAQVQVALVLRSKNMIRQLCQNRDDNMG